MCGMLIVLSLYSLHPNRLYITLALAERGRSKSFVARSPPRAASTIARRILYHAEKHKSAPAPKWADPTSALAPSAWLRYLSNDRRRAL